MCIPVLPKYTIYSFCSAPVIFPSATSTSTVWIAMNQRQIFSDSSHQQCKWDFHSLSAGLQQRCAPYVNIWRLFIFGLQRSSLGGAGESLGPRKGGKLCVLMALCFECRTYRLCFGNAQHGWWFVYIREADHHTEVWDLGWCIGSKGTINMFIYLHYRSSGKVLQDEVKTNKDHMHLFSRGYTVYTLSQSASSPSTSVSLKKKKNLLSMFIHL